jgi:hypothetical protein
VAFTCIVVTNPFVSVRTWLKVMPTPARVPSESTTGATLSHHIWSVSSARAASSTSRTWLTGLAGSVASLKPAQSKPVVKLLHSHEYPGAGPSLGPVADQSSVRGMGVNGAAGRAAELTLRKASVVRGPVSSTLIRQSGCHQLGDSR